MLKDRGHIKQTPDDKMNRDLPKDGASNGDDRIKILFYSHDTMGLGHLQRNHKIAFALKKSYTDLKISLLTGSSLTSHFKPIPNLDFINLPPVRKVGKEKYEPFDPENPFETVLERRKSIILNSLKDLNPDIFWVDHAPVGMKGELLPALQWITGKSNATVAVLGLRDIIDHPDNVVPLWEEQKIFDIIRSSYKRIFIYGDSRVFNPLKEYGFPADIAEKTSFTGYITNTDDDRSADNSGFELSGSGRVFVTIGGGEWAGEIIIGNLFAAARANNNRLPFDVTVVTGPFFPDELWRLYSEMAKELSLEMMKFVPDIRPYIYSSDLVVSTAGYNTVADVLNCGKRALFIPRVKFRQEQFLRARRFAELGMVEILIPEDVTPGSLMEKISRLLENPGCPLEAARQKKIINLNGAGQVSEYINEFILKMRS
jgi:predicted glycosyltransferase